MSHNESFEIAYCNIDDNEDLSNLAIQIKETKIIQEKLIEALGHTPIQVFVGAFIGFVVGYIV